MTKGKTRATKKRKTDDGGDKCGGGGGGQGTWVFIAHPSRPLHPRATDVEALSHDAPWWAEVAGTYAEPADLGKR